MLVGGSYGPAESTYAAGSTYTAMPMGAPAGGPITPGRGGVHFSGPNAYQAAGNSAGDCTGACGGMESACCEAEGAVQNTNWQYVGDGRGAYSTVPQYGFVGEGHGSFEREVVTTYYGWKLRKCCIGILVLALIPLVLYLMLLMANPATIYPVFTGIDKYWKVGGGTPAPTPVPTFPKTSEPYNCFQGGLWTIARKDWCCKNHGRGCTTRPPPTKPAPTTVAATLPPRQVPVPIPIPVPTPAPNPGMTSLPYDCNADFTTCYHCLEQRWSVAKRAWCCTHAQRGCPTAPPIATLPATVAPFDCNAGFLNWQAGWSIGKKAWCCQHMQKGCPVATSPPFDCNAGFVRWKEGWSLEKKVWCCKQQHQGCPEPTPTQSLGGIGSCTVWGDPHVLTFDGMRSDYYSSGEYWLVKTPEIHIQGRYLPTKATNGLAVTKILAVGGPFLGGHKLLISPTWTTWDGQQILQGLSSHFEDKAHVQIVYNNKGELLQKGRAGKQKKVVHARIADGTPEGLQIQVNRWTEASEGNYINAKITMRSRPGQDGHCGNFNGQAADDDRIKVRARLGTTGVPPQELIFETKNPVTQGNRPDINNCPAPKLEAAKADCRAKEGKGKFVIPSMSCLIDYCFANKEMAMNG